MKWQGGIHLVASLEKLDEAVAREPHQDTTTKKWKTGKLRCTCGNNLGNIQNNLKVPAFRQREMAFFKIANIHFELDGQLHRVVKAIDMGHASGLRAGATATLAPQIVISAGMPCMPYAPQDPAKKTKVTPVEHLLPNLQTLLSEQPEIPGTRFKDAYQKRFNQTFPGDRKLRDILQGLLTKHPNTFQILMRESSSGASHPPALWVTILPPVRRGMGGFCGGVNAT